MRKSVKIGIPALAIVAASFVVGAWAGGGSSGGDRHESQKALVAAAVTAAPPETTPSFVEASAPDASPPTATGIDTRASGGVAQGGAAADDAQQLPDVAALAPTIQQRVIQTATLSVTVAQGSFDDAFNRARAIATGFGGFVTSSSTSQGPDQRLVRGTLVLRIPEQAYAQAINQLTQLGRVRSQQETGQDVSQQYVDLRARENHLVAVEAQLLGFLKRTTTVSEALAVQSRLNDVQLQLEEVRGQITYLDDATSYATITMDLVERGVAVATKTKEPHGGWSFADAWHAAESGFKKVVGGFLVAIVVAGPILAALALAFLIGRALLRRRAPRPEQPGGAAPPALG